MDKIKLTYEPLRKDDTPKKVICICNNPVCGDRFGGNAAGQCAIYCKNCKTAAGREAILDENIEIFGGEDKLAKALGL